MENLMLFGTGYMGTSYAKVLQQQQVPFQVIGRGTQSAQTFTRETGVPVETGGAEDWIRRQSRLGSTAVVAVNGENLSQVTRSLLQAGVKKILLEKPGGSDAADIRSLAQGAEKAKAKIFLGYNRRFYASTHKALQLIREEGGVDSFCFEFTEWSHTIENGPYSKKILEEWFLHNSSHVADLAFFLGGWPKEIAAYSSGKLRWHPRASKYSGAGVSESGAPFSYHANWGAPGRWWVEALTSKNRYIFRPMEKLHVQKIGSVAIDPVGIDDELDLKFKPGLYREVAAFLTGKDSESLLSLDTLARRLWVYERMEKTG